MQNVFMTRLITVRDVPDEAYAELHSRAGVAGQSLQEYLHARLVELARRPDAKAVMARVHAGKQTATSSLPTEKILAYRDAGRQ